MTTCPRCATGIQEELMVDFVTESKVCPACSMAVINEMAMGVRIPESMWPVVNSSAVLARNDHILEAVCSKCGEVFNPSDWRDTEHYVSEDGELCGGEGWVLGAWSA